jgi:hypothetical protein
VRRLLTSPDHTASAVLKGHFVAARKSTSRLTPLSKMPRPLDPKKPYQLTGTISRVIGWVVISPMPDDIRAELLKRLSECLSLLSKVTGNDDEAPESQKLTKEGEKGR